MLRLWRAKQPNFGQELHAYLRPEAIQEAAAAIPTHASSFALELPYGTRKWNDFNRRGSAQAHD